MSNFYKATCIYADLATELNIYSLKHGVTSFPSPTHEHSLVKSIRGSQQYSRCLCIYAVFLTSGKERAGEGEK